MSSRTELVPSSPLKRGKKGWAPLVYPGSALCGDQDNDSQKNHLFPFEENVVRAALRELLILDKSVSSDNLGLSLGTINFLGGLTGPSYLQHVDPGRWQPLPIMKNKKSIGKKRSITMSHKAKKMAKTNSERVMEAGNDHNTWENTEKKVANAQALVDVIVLRATNDQSIFPLKTTRSPRKMRKVSDADGKNDLPVLSCSNEGIKQFDATYSDREISRYFDITSRCMYAKELPAFLDVSISSESHIRQQSIDITRVLFQSFEDETLRVFLGYKSSTVKRDRLLVVLAEHLFDVSHAMFAWKQTEDEITSHGSPKIDLETQVLTMLFDNRALQKIGGFDDSSLLPHALSIRRLADKGVDWEVFSQTMKGRALLQHHREGKAVLVGEKRRGLRIRDRSRTEQRSRSSSISSFDTIEHMYDDGICGTIVDGSHVELWSERQPASMQTPDALLVSLKKSASKSWGILLAKEGDMCVVVRGSQASTTTIPLALDSSLKVGDVILSVGTKHENMADEEKRDWFRFVVNKFKSSNELDLVVRRVGCPQSILVPDDGSRGDKEA